MPAKFISRLLSAALLLAAPLAGPANAQEEEEDRFFIFGLGVVNEPVFSGSANTEADLDYYINARRGRFFFNDYGLGLDVVRFGADSDFALGVAIGYEEGRSEEDDPALQGLGDIDSTFEAALLFEGEAGPVEFGLAIVQDIGSGHDGLYVDVEAGVDRDISDRIAVELGVTSRWGDSSYSQAFYGINGAQSLRSDYPVYEAGSGLVSAGVELEATYAINDRTFVQFGIEAGTLLGDAKDSPLTEKDEFLAVSIGLARRF